MHIGSFTRAVGRGIRRYCAYVRKAGPGTVPTFATYDLPHLGCLHRTDTPAQNVGFRHWIRAFAGAIGRHRAVVFLEEDALITIGCLSRGGLAVRMFFLNSSHFDWTSNELHYGDRVARNGRLSEPALLRPYAPACPCGAPPPTPWSIAPLTPASSAFTR